MNVTKRPEAMDFSDIVYLDNAATTFPKPPEVLERMTRFYRAYGVNPGRSGYDMSRYAGEMVDGTRAALAAFFGSRDSDRLIFCANATDALNLLLRGLLSPGDHVATSIAEHNSVIRTLHHLRDEEDISVDFLPVGDDGRLAPEQIAAAVRETTKLVIINHGSNVTGIVQPIAAIGALCRERGVRFALDAAQTAGVVPIDMEAMNVDAVAFTGHKSLMGPMGIGGLCFNDRIDLRPFRTGGTGFSSAEPHQPLEYPWRLEAGTLNLPGVAGLRYGFEWVQSEGIENLHRREMALFTRLQDGLLAVEGVKIHGPTTLEHRIPVLNFSIDGMDPEKIGTFLDVDYNVAVRTGLHCAPLLHRHMGTDERGTVRMSLGPFNNSDQIDAAVTAVREIAAEM